MSAISDYASLLIDAGEYAGANDIANVFPRLVALAEAKFNRVLRVAEMETVGTVTLIDGNADLPADFLEARLVTAPDGSGLSAWSLSELNRRFGTYGGIPAGYSVVGGAIRVRPHRVELSRLNITPRSRRSHRQTQQTGFLRKHLTPISTVSSRRLRSGRRMSTASRRAAPLRNSRCAVSRCRMSGRGGATLRSSSEA